MKLPFLALFCLLFFSSCASKNTVTRAINPGEEKIAWQLFSSRVNQSEDAPFRLEASLRYSGPDITSARVYSILWGNGQSTSPYPLRLDLTAGLGTVIAKVREDTDNFLAYSPQEKTAYTSKRNDKNNKDFVSFGVPIPLSMGDLSLLLTGHSGLLFLPQNSPHLEPQVVGLTSQGISFATTTAKLSGVIEISPNGVLLSWKESQNYGWSIYFENDKDNLLYPKKITITHPKGYEAVITVKGFSLLKNAFSHTQLDLLLPAGTIKKVIRNRD